MQPNLQQGFADELAAVQQRLASARGRLAKTEDREESAACRLEITLREQQYLAVEKAQLAVLSADSDVSETVAKFRKWRGFFLECHELKAKIEQLKKPIEKVQNELIAAQYELDKATTARDKHRSRPLSRGNFPTETEIAAWNARLAELEADVKTKIEARQEKQVLVSNANGTYGATVLAFDAASLSERVSRLPDAILNRFFGNQAAVR